MSQIKKNNSQTQRTFTTYYNHNIASDFPQKDLILVCDLGAEPIDPDAKSSNLINDFRTSDFIEPSELNQSSSSSLTPPKRGAGT